MKYTYLAQEILSAIALCVIILCGTVYTYSQVTKKNVFCDGPTVNVGQSFYRQCIVEQ